MNKKILAALTLITASSTQAAFDEGNAILFAYDAADDDTYFVDLGVTGQDIVDRGYVESLTDSGLATFLSNNAGAQWTIIASVNDTDNVGGPPAIGASLANSGVVSTSLSGAPVGSDGTTNDQQRLIMNGWLADVQAASGGSSSFGVAGTDPSSSDAARNGGFFNDSLIAVGSSSDIFYSQANPADGTTLADANVVTRLAGQAGGLASLSPYGTIEYGVACLGDYEPFCEPPPPPPAPEVPIPATAWLFGSALAGLIFVKRKS